ncbi:MAG: DUF1461 domain-containing protein [Akkermansiaceae bacterium]
MAGVLVVAQPTVFKSIYGYAMSAKPEMLDDGLLIAEELSGTQPYTEINKNLSGGRLGKREIYHFEDIRKKLLTAKVVAVVSLVGMLLVGVACSARWKRVATWSLIWFVSIIIASAVWAVYSFRHFFRTLHWWVFQDDSWILPKGCYSLRLYPYAVWQVSGVVLAGVVLILLAISCGVMFRISRKKRKPT